MKLTDADIQRARRISDAIEDYLNQTGDTMVRSTDVYQFLRRKGLVEDDRHQGLHFRRFLHKLKDNEALNLIPQCEAVERNSNFTDWYFHRNNKAESSLRRTTSKWCPPQALKEKIARLPKRDVKDLDSRQLTTRKSYPRAYEYWSGDEIKLLKKAYKEWENSNKLSKVFQRQPSAIESRLKKMGLIK